MRPITIGQTQEGEAVIAKGLTAGEQVVREGQFLLGPGSRVDIKQEAKSVDASGEKGGEQLKRGGDRGKAKPQARGAS